MVSDCSSTLLKHPNRKIWKNKGGICCGAKKVSEFGRHSDFIRIELRIEKQAGRRQYKNSQRCRPLSLLCKTCPNLISDQVLPLQL